MSRELQGLPGFARNYLFLATALKRNQKEMQVSQTNLQENAGEWWAGQGLLGCTALVWAQHRVLPSCVKKEYQRCIGEACSNCSKKVMGKRFKP